jgi:hypothetical protein
MANLDGNFWSRQRDPSGRLLQPSTGGSVRVTGPAAHDRDGNALPAGTNGNGVVVQMPNDSVGRGVGPFNKDSARDR